MASDAVQARSEAYTDCSTVSVGVGRSSSAQPSTETSASANNIHRHRIAMYRDFDRRLMIVRATLVLSFLLSFTPDIFPMSAAAAQATMVASITACFALLLCTAALLWRRDRLDRQRDADREAA